MKEMRLVYNGVYRKLELLLKKRTDNEYNTCISNINIIPTGYIKVNMAVYCRFL